MARFMRNRLSEPYLTYTATAISDTLHSPQQCAAAKAQLCRKVIRDDAGLLTSVAGFRRHCEGLCALYSLKQENFARRV